MIDFDELKKINFKYNVIKYYQINLIHSGSEFKEILIKNTIITKLKNNNYKDLFDIINMLEHTITINETYNMSFCLMYKYIDMTIYIKVIKTIINCFVSVDCCIEFRNIIENEKCKKCMYNTMQFLIFKSELSKFRKKIKYETLFKIRKVKKNNFFEMKLAKKYFIFLPLYFYFVLEETYSISYQYHYLLKFIENDDINMLMKQINNIKKSIIKHQKLIYWHDRNDLFHLNEIKCVSRHIHSDYLILKELIDNYIYYL